MNAERTSTVAILAARAMENAGAPYALVGSLASTLHGEPRGTLDVDFATLMCPGHVERFLLEVSGAFATDAEWVREAVRERSLFQLVHLGSFIKVDVYVRDGDGPDAAQVLRAQRLVLGDDPADELSVASAEDTVLQKLSWFQQGGGVSDRQWRDVVGVIKARQAALDLDYMSRWAAGRGVGDLLQRALEAARI